MTNGRGAAAGGDTLSFPAAVPAAARAGRRRHGVGARFGDLSLFWKLLLPFLALIVVLGVAGGYFIVRDLTSRAQASLDQDLARRSLDARSVLRDRELYLLESANLASNLEGMATSIQARDATEAARLLQSVLALKTDLDLLAVAGPDGTGLAEFARPSPGGPAQRGAGGRWSASSFVAQALRDASGGKHAGYIEAGGRTLLAIAAPVCSGDRTCAPVGATVVAAGADRLAAETLDRLARDARRAGLGVAIYDLGGRRLASAGSAAAGPAPALVGEHLERRTSGAGADATATLYAPLEVRDRVVGTLAVSLRSDPAFASVRGTGWRLGLVLLAAMAGIIAIGAQLSRIILRQVRSLVATNRALGRGDLAARAEVPWKDEIGELASGVNEMAEQLQAMYATLELRVAQRTEEVERLLKERTQFFASVSHDLRTPLAVILRNSEMLLDPAYKTNGRARGEATRALQASGSQLHTLINDILTLARDEHGGTELDLEDLRLADAVRDVRGTIDALARGSGIRAKIRIPKDLPDVRADRRRLREMILNLADNAVKYTPEGGTVEISARQTGDAVEVSVSDTGVGIPRDCGERIFEPFYRVPETTPQQGQASSGLGLAVVRRLVAAHGGHIVYESAPGAGTTFTFTLPTTLMGAAPQGAGRRHG